MYNGNLDVGCLKGYLSVIDAVRVLLMLGGGLGRAVERGVAPKGRGGIHIYSLTRREVCTTGITIVEGIQGLSPNVSES